MPCYQINYITVRFKAKNKHWLEAAAKSLGWAYAEAGRYVQVGMVNVDLERQTAKASSQSSINRLKQQYSAEAVAELARKKRWAVKTMGKNKVQLRRY